MFSCLSLICELSFFICYLCSNYSLSHVKNLLTDTLIVNYLLENLFKDLSERSPIELVNQLCLTLKTIGEIPSLSSLSSLSDSYSYLLLKYLYNKRICSLSILEYLILIQHCTKKSNSLKMIKLLNEYLIEMGIHQNNLNIICHLLILISSSSYSHELFHKEIIEKIKINLEKNKQSI